MAFELRHTDEIATVLLLLLTAVVFYVTADFPAGPGETSPAFFPRVVVSLIAFFALVQLGRSLSRGTVRSHEIRWSQAKPALIITALIVAYVVTMPVLGFVLGTVLFLLVGMHYSGVERVRHSVPISITVSIVLYYLFWEFLRVPLPRNEYVEIEGWLPTLWSIPVPGVTG